MKQIRLTLFLTLGLGYIGLQAQEAISATGGNASGIGGSVSFTIGQVVYSTNSGSSGSVAQGVQQPYEISVVTGLEAAKDITLVYSVYPNPAIELLNLKVENCDKSHLSYQLFNLDGKLLEYKEITDVVNVIKMSDFPMASYYLKIFENKIVVKTFKIIKN